MCLCLCVLVCLCTCVHRHSQTNKLPNTNEETKKKQARIYLYIYTHKYINTPSHPPNPTPQGGAHQPATTAAPAPGGGLSTQYEGLLLTFARLVRAVWYKPVVVVVGAGGATTLLLRPPEIRVGGWRWGGGMGVCMYICMCVYVHNDVCMYSLINPPTHNIRCA